MGAFASKSFFISIDIVIFSMKFFTFQFLSAAMLVLCAFAAPLSEELSLKLIKRLGEQEEKRVGFRGWFVAPEKQENCEYKDGMMCCHRDEGNSDCVLQMRPTKRVLGGYNYPKNPNNHHHHGPHSSLHRFRTLNKEQ